jgi:hypothetical protein
VAGWFLSFFPLLGQAISFRCGPPAHPPTYEANWMDEREAHPPPTSPTDRSMYISLDLGNRRRRRRRRSTAAAAAAAAQPPPPATHWYASPLIPLSLSLLLASCSRCIRMLARCSLCACGSLP